MALLKSVDDVPGIDFYEYRDNDYYNKYAYRARIILKGIRYTWWADTIADVKERLSKKSNYYQTRVSEQLLINENLPIIEAYLNWRDINAPKKTKNKKLIIRIEYDTCAVFSNDLTMLQDIKTIHPDIQVDITAVQRTSFQGVKHFVRDPKHKFRVYLKAKRIGESFVTDLESLINRSDNLHPSPALLKWIENFDNYHNVNYWRYRYSSPTHFIDYDDESTLSYLAIMYGEMLGKRYKLEKRPVTV